MRNGLRGRLPVEIVSHKNELTSSLTINVSEDQGQTAVTITPINADDLEMWCVPASSTYVKQKQYNNANQF